MKSHRPITPGRRQLKTVSFRQSLTVAEPYKPLTAGFKRRFGRNKAGRITVRHKGGGHKRLLRQIDFRYDKIGIPAKVESVEYDPNRSGFIGLSLYADGVRRYVLLPQGLKPGDEFIVSEDAVVKPGNRLPLRKIPVGTFVYNVEIYPRGGAKLVRSAGNLAEVLATDGGYTVLKLPSSEIRRVSENAWATIGAVSNEEHKLVVSGKAGRSRWLGIRPTVRGSAMNPVDHPRGGGEGRSGRGRRREISFSGKPVGKGQKTRLRHKYSDIFRVSRRKVGKKIGV